MDLSNFVALVFQIMCETCFCLYGMPLVAPVLVLNFKKKSF